MPLTDHVGHAALRWSLTGDNEPMVVTFHYDAAAHPGAPAAAASAIRAAWFASYGAGDLNDGWTFLGCRVRQGTSGGVDEIGASDVAVAGTFVSAELPQNCAFLVHKRTSAPGRKGQGRCYFPPCLPIGEGDVSNTGAIVAGAITGNNSKLAQFRTDLDTAGVPMLVAEADGFPSYTVDTLTMDPIIATQRRRLRR